MIRKFPSLKRIFGWIEKIPRNRKLLLWKQEMDGFAGRWYAAFATRQPQASFLQMWPDCYSAHGASVAPWHVGFQLDSSAAGFDPCVRFFFFFFFVSSFDYTFHHAQLVKVVAMNNSVSRLIHFAPVPRVARGFAERTQWARRDRNRSGIFFRATRRGKLVDWIIHEEGEDCFHGFSSAFSFRAKLSEAGFVLRIVIFRSLGYLYRNDCWKNRELQGMSLDRWREEERLLAVRSSISRMKEGNFVG